MKRTGNPNINTKVYWNHVYGDESKRREYLSQGMCVNAIDNLNQSPTYRFVRTLEEIKDGDKFVDMGCGVGALTTMVKKTYPSCEVWGTDISDQAIKDNSKKNPNIKYLHQYIGDQKELPDKYFDVVFSGEVLEHLDEPRELFRDALRVLKKGGKFILTTPSGDAVQSSEHVTEFTHEDIEMLFISHGFSKPQFVYLPDMESMYVIYAIGEKL